MNESKKQRNNYNSMVINYLEKKFGISKTYIRQSIDGTRHGITCDLIRKEYLKKSNEVHIALSKILYID